MNGPREAGHVVGLHRVPNPLSYRPFPSTRVGPVGSLSLRRLGHRFPRLGVESQPLGLVGRLAAESDVVSAFSSAALHLVRRIPNIVVLVECELVSRERKGEGRERFAGFVDCR